MNGAVFNAYVEQVLVPGLNPGDIVIMDNLPSHKVYGVREAIKAAKAYLPLCRPILQTSTPSSWRSPN